MLYWDCMENTLAVVVGQKVRDARLRAKPKISGADVAKELALTEGAYYHCERGVNLFGVEHLVKLPAILGCKITDLLPDSVVTDYDRQRAKDPLLAFLTDHWSDLPSFLQSGIYAMALDAVKEKQKQRE